jgi:hypothetical protein
MLLVKNNKLPKGVRKLEFYDFEGLESLKDSIAEYNLLSCINSLEILISLYLELREVLYDDSINFRIDAQDKTLKYLHQIKLEHMRL